MIDQYIFSGSLPENASTYVTREADAQLYEGLKAGKFCYVLNSRQSGKSSLRVRTMQRLRKDGVHCAAVDLSAGGIQNVPPEQWYADLIDTLIDSFGLDVDFGDWWEANHLNSLVTRFRKFLEEILLVEVKENIVIFIDEIDSVLSLNFPTDDFFALIRACYNKRVDNPEYNRLTFCLLGVASPSNLIEDKQRTPFNIGQAISLKGFQLHEVEPLEKGLYGKFSRPQVIMQEILQWTSGQPFLTQKLCQFMVEESEQEHPRSVEQVVRSRIIESWESQDEPEHLRTIQARILRDEQRAAYLLELYQQVRLAEERSQVIADDTLEQSELQLSGLVVRQQGKLRIYNQIYREIFNLNWIENQLNNLRPYSENFRFWVASGGTDESRLLRGKALQEAEEWAKDKNLSYQDKQYLAASKEKEIEQDIAVKQQEAALEREKQDRDALEARNQLLSEANKKAQRRISIGAIALIVTLIGSAIVGIFSGKRLKRLDEIHDEVVAVQDLNKLARELEKNTNATNSEGIIFYSTEALRLSALSFNVSNHQLKKALVLSASSQAHQQLKDLKDAESEIKQSQKLLAEADKKVLESSQGLQIQVLSYNSQGDFFAKNQQNQNAIESYRTAFNILKTHPNQTDFTQNNQLLTGENIESVYRSLIKLNPQDKEVKESLTQHLYAQLEYFLKAKNWSFADFKTYKLMLNIAQREEQGYLDYEDINRFSCPDLQRIDKLWVNADNRFGFSVQKKIWRSTGNRLGIKPQDWTDKDNKNYLRFAEAVGWYDNKLPDTTSRSRGGGDFVSFDDFLKRIKSNSAYGRGGLPTVSEGRRVKYSGEWVAGSIERGLLLSRCDL
ncbi:AAA-like domain-containing protein [Nostoc sp. ChiQUE01b]|uniref:AAA-like domain-containing protein n=1 Tax=Nostoc sp. ChiQUE01b TaxID=3075376 RepID=UPI002AD3A790|nr:AAA-like domain-containing protein [Nostoc sp. ChiQUE01b]MDZ8262976.1 AAA-like domain-containing protein [Nostoc sp. ChiQUE01b]